MATVSLLPETVPTQSQSISIRALLSCQDEAIYSRVCVVVIRGRGRCNKSPPTQLLSCHQVSAPFSVSRKSVCTKFMMKNETSIYLTSAPSSDRNQPPGGSLSAFFNQTPHPECLLCHNLQQGCDITTVRKATVSNSRQKTGGFR